MSEPANASNEVVEYRHSEALRGVLGVKAERSPREWRVITPAYAVVVFRTWRGFADQSHFTRHFKRLYGVTPMQYARVGTSTTRASGKYRIPGDPSAVLGRSDR